MNDDEQEQPLIATKCARLLFRGLPKPGNSAVQKAQHSATRLMR